ncbi:MAG TPA: hypothetical protein VMY78_12580 [Solirubrobacteraceae bacterium]|nr:hypothetical protein [Solirubrobacteraceae bacterium]
MTAHDPHIAGDSRPPVMSQTAQRTSACIGQAIGTPREVVGMLAQESADVVAARQDTRLPDRIDGLQQQSVRQRGAPSVLIGSRLPAPAHLIPSRVHHLACSS